MTRRGLFTGIGALTLGNLASACSPLGLLNTLGPRDRGARRIAQGIPYGAAARQKFDLYGPAWSEGQPRAPVIVFFYGGGWDSGSRELYGWAAQALASRGFVVALLGSGAVLSYAIAPLPLLLAVALTALEFLVAFLQAYVFAVLTCMYLNDAVHGGH